MFTTKTQSTIKKMQSLGEVLDAESYQWLASNHPDILEAIETEINNENGVTPEQIRYFVLIRTGRQELAVRCQAAARHAMVIRE